MDKAAELADPMYSTLSLDAAIAPQPPPSGCTTSDLGTSGSDPMLGMSDADLTRELDTMWNTDIRWLRFDVDWSIVESTRGQQNWCAIDRLVDRARGLNLLGIITYTPAWARIAGTSDSHGRPADPAAFATFAKQAAQRYNGRVTTWEIWNEPDLVNFFRPAPDADAYVQLLSAAAQAIRSCSRAR